MSGLTNAAVEWTAGSHWLAATGHPSVRSSDRPCPTDAAVGGSGHAIEHTCRASQTPRVEIAMALWESLPEAEREAELALTPEQEAELDRRLAEHVANAGSAIPWDEVRRKLAGEA